MTTDRDGPSDDGADAGPVAELATPRRLEDVLWGVTACKLCGLSAIGDALPLDWSLDVDARGARPVCPACTRQRIRDIEGKLGLGED